MFILNDITNVCNDYAIARALSLIKFAYQTICILVPIFLIVAASIQIASMVGNPDQKDGGKKIGMKFVYAIIIFFLPWLTNYAIAFLQNSGLSISRTNVVACWDAGDAVNETIGNPADYANIPPTTSGNGLIGDLSALKIYAQQALEEAAANAQNNSAGTILQGGQPVPIYYQSDYPDVVLTGSSTVSSSGCGFTSVAMVISYLTGETVTPRDIVDDWSREYYDPDAGMEWTFPGAAAEHYGVGTVTRTTDGDQVLQALRNGQVVITSQKNGIFNTTGNGHIVVLRGLNAQGQVLVNDPNYSNAITRGFNNRGFDFESEIDSTSQQYWIFPKK